MKLPTILQLAKGTAKFLYYTDFELWYDIMWCDDADVKHFQFPIRLFGDGNAPIRDAGGCFMAEEKGLALMKWARKHLEMLQKTLDEQRNV